MERFETALQRLAPSNKCRFLLAVSGGPDSLALLFLAGATRHGQVAAATVDHGLRPEAAHEATYVAEICKRLQVPHQTLHPSVPLNGSSIQA
ncbi:MAG: ATP-binding protein, partial [Sphingorhabdus sp.]